MRIQAVALLVLGLAIPTLIRCNSEGDILFKQRTVWNDPYGVLESWNSTLVNPCTWFHVTCNNDNSVIRLDLGNAGLSGPLNPELGDLINLQYLELYQNNISGNIPDEFGNLTRLVSLDLYQNSLSGSIPSSLHKLQSLRFLRLNGNKLSGHLPRKVLDLVLTGSLIALNVSDNLLEGTIRSSQPRVATITQDQSSRA